jgi:hypothetical protein
MMVDIQLSLLMKSLSLEEKENNLQKMKSLEEIEEFSGKI